MLDIKSIRDNTAEVAARLKRRGEDLDVEAVVALEKERVAATGRVEELKKERNELSRLTGQRMKNGESASDLQDRARAIGEEVKILDENLKNIQEQIKQRLLAIPNTPDDSTPDGADETANKEIHRWGEPPRFSFAPKSHGELGEALGVLDFPRAVKMAGARSALYIGAGAALERALINFMLDTHTSENGYTETIPPLMVNSAAMTGTGQLPKFAEDLFKLEGEDLWLIPTAEVPLTNIYAGEILKEESLPISITAYTPCFRSEAGSYGKDTAGLIRLHQFSKVELVKL
ncbi:MAG: serine--tRNA ligase, partial [Nitrospinota bacterium]|nr:serine--tRNA ligase [Nitrospinota bacterium]